MRGHQADGFPAGGAGGEGVSGDVLGLELFEEVEGAAAAGTFLRAGGGVEERADGVEVTVGVAAGGPAAAGAAFEALRPGGAVPEGPQDLLGGAAAGEEFAGLAQQQAEALRSAGVGGVVGDEPLRLREGAGEEDVGGRGGADAGGPLLVAQGAAEPAEVGGVHPAERRGQQHERGLDPDPRFACGGLAGSGSGLGAGPAGAAFGGG